MKVNLFFDESGKGNDKIKTMGSLLIPHTIYNTKNFLQLNEQLKSENFKLHWTQFSGGKDEITLYKNILTIFSKYSSLCEFNIIRYNYPQGINQDSLKKMIYGKIPERVMYGLLRHEGSNMDIEADIYVEEATMYVKTIKLHESLVNEMNKQSLYRGTHFKINKFKYKKKNEEIGVELTDLILGIIRTIIVNNNESNRLKKKNKLIIELLKDKNFYKFLSNIKYFEWNYSNSLTKVNFCNYINVFLSSQEDWINYLEES